jgi:chemotaxis protein CheZ
MTKKMKFDEAGDSDELQALFDSMAAPAAKPRLEVVEQRLADGDCDDLQALFDSVAEEFGDTDQIGEAAPAAATTAPSGEGAAAPQHSCETVYTRIGQMTRQVHDTLSALGFDKTLQQAAEAMPDARQRLSYIAQMTEQAASRVLNATDIAKPAQDKILSGAEQLNAAWEKLFANQLSVDEFKALAARTRGYLGAVVEDSHTVNAQLIEIMMAQDFQDLTGQVIKKVVDLAQQLESQLLEVLLETIPADKRPEKLVDRNAGLMNGPVVSAEGRDDVVTSQEQVDDLLESLGF